MYMYRSSTITWVSNMFDQDQAIPQAQIDKDRIAVIGKALAHPARVQIIAFLLSKPGCIGGDIVDKVGLAQSTVSEHLRILKDAGIVTGTIEYPRVCYALDAAAFAPLRDLIDIVAARPSNEGEPCCYTPQGCVPKETAR